MRTTLFVGLLAILGSAAHAQVAEDSELFKTLMGLDDAIFEKSFNRCDHSDLLKLIPDDFEFYHDTGGFENSKESFMATVERNICGNPAVKPIRKLVSGSLEVYPLMNGDGTLYGAVQQGVHEFYLREEGKPLRLTSTARFTHVWIFKDEAWTLKRVLSYDHHAPDDTH
ncbi:nuclear transport factor 2 family protein [Gimibacter soli]|uniref:Nuclear transport factor 2 family protein n=1 Tax=Gimibacter soli TaxID=3024400 RepID=A0AAF0BLS1_9PROT|nr:nuclear transport factor 2 family protein [Gimibacter soli]WCL53790.1 nuclear transport factor 2 family protein [Gimibacter soli]